MSFVNREQDVLLRPDDRLPAVLVVEDDAVFRATLAEGLRERGFTAGTASDLREAVALLPGSWDVVFLDLLLPDGDAQESLTAVMRAAEGIPVVVVSSSDRETLRESAAGLGVREFLSKRELDLDEAGRAAVRAVVQAKLERRQGLVDARHRGNTEAYRLEMMNLVSHELRTPLTTALLRLDLIDRQAPDVQDHTNAIRRQVDRLARLADRLVTAYEAESARVHRVERRPLAPLITRARHGTAIDVRARVPTKTEVVADPDDVVFALHELIENAEHAGASVVDIRVRTDAENICIDVRDDGPGLHPEIARNLGRPFVNTLRQDGQGKGLGMGLHLVRARIEQSGGAFVLLDEARAHFEIRLGRP